MGEPDPIVQTASTLGMSNAAPQEPLPSRHTDSLLEVDLPRCRRFEKAWHEGQPIPIEEVLPPPDDPLFAATLEELVVIDLDFRCRNSDAARVEEYLPGSPC